MTMKQMATKASNDRNISQKQFFQLIMYDLYHTEPSVSV